MCLENKRGKKNDLNKYQCMNKANFHSSVLNKGPWGMTQSDESRLILISLHNTREPFDTEPADTGETSSTWTGIHSGLYSARPPFLSKKSTLAFFSIDDYLLKSYLIFIYITKPLLTLLSNFTSFSQWI